MLILLKQPKEFLFCFTVFLVFTTAARSQKVLHEKDIVYGVAKNWQNQMEELKLDLFHPHGSKKLPLLVYIHGGGFNQGSRWEGEGLSNKIAEKNFIVANIEYRIGFDSSRDKFQSEIIKAIYRAQQDANTAIRFLVKNAKKYHIDTSMIFIGGSSAGAITALGASFITAGEWKNIYPPAETQLGSMNNSGSQNNIRLRGVMTLFGGILDTALISKTEMQNIPFLAFHSKDDEVIPYGKASNPEAKFNSLFGDSDIAQRYRNNGYHYQLYFRSNAKHGFGYSQQYVADKFYKFYHEIKTGKNRNVEEENKDPNVSVFYAEY
jgi:predicted esterase